MAADDFPSADELRARIAAAAARKTRLLDTIAETTAEVAAALERQQLRRELEEVEDLNGYNEQRIQANRHRRRLIDQDLDLPIDSSHPPKSSTLARAPRGQERLIKETIAFDHAVSEQEFTWEVRGLSWLPDALKHEDRECTASSIFAVDEDDSDSRYKLVFSPHAGSLVAEPDDDDDCYRNIGDGVRGSLALVRKEANCGTSVELSFFVHDGNTFVQWGETTRVAVPATPLDEAQQCAVFGPDLESETKGIFGLSFEELLRSRWVRDDALTVKVAIKEVVMKEHPEFKIIRIGQTDLVAEPAMRVDVPPSTLAADFLTMLTSGSHSDLTIVAAYGEAAEPERFAVHASVLSQRSAVFRAALEHGMSESASHTITVTDVPPPALKALLHFLYTDDFEQVQAVLRGSDSSAASSSASNGSTSTPHTLTASTSTAAAPDSAQRMAQLQAVLAAAHKYQVTRLLRWCEQQLCESFVRCETVCSLLGLAHVYEATELEECCLRHMKNNMAAVAEQPEFGALAPACLVKLNLHCTGVELAESRKRKHGA